QVRDSSSKVIFDDHTLYAQFLRDYVKLPYMKSIRPEDIEDISERYVPLFAEERDSDRVKRVNIGEGKPPFFLVSLTEHKSEPDYNVCMQVFRYMVYIWESYEKEMEAIQKGMSRRVDFLYPPILPIVYYEGAAEWNVPLNFRSRIREGETFGKYLPDFEYYLVPLRDYSNKALMERRDEISIAMMINKLQTPEDIENFRKLPGDEIDAILRNSPAHLVDTIADVLRALLLKMKMPVAETEMLVCKVKEKKMGELFANVKMDIMAERQNTANAERRANEAERRADEAERRADEAERLADEALKNVAILEETVRKLMEKLNLDTDSKKTAPDGKD
ncbi:MAG TPA: hypothetical protein DCZ91_25040, partial [Lachnospiraceae bacterium]|nr:hypothetical protein [Lachnospiraceae bacterium]